MERQYIIIKILKFGKKTPGLMSHFHNFASCVKLCSPPEP